MKKYIFLFIFILLISCSTNKGVYWCGDHPCINKAEKEDYFKKTMIVEVRNYDKKNIKKDSEIEKLLKQAKLDEKNRILNERELLKRTKLEEKELAKKLKLEEKRRIKEEKNLIKQLKYDEKQRKKKEKELAKQLKIEKKNSKQKSKKGKNIVKVYKKKINNEENTLVIGGLSENVEISSSNFNQLVEKIIKRNSSRSYPEINDIPK